MNSASIPTRIKDAKFRALCARIQKEMKRLKVPGVAVGVWNRGREHSAGFGITNIENPLPVTPDTLFQTGSISKTFTATLLMQLAEQGKIQLDAPVRKYIKGFKLRDAEVARRVTIRHLLTHTGGWVGDYFNDLGNGDDALEKMVLEIAKLPQVQPLGKIWSYNNTGFNIAARVIEIVAKKPYEQCVQERLFDPLGLDMSFFYPSDRFLTYRFAAGHQIVAGKVSVARPWAIGRASNGVGGVISTVKDLLKYARFHMSRGKKNVISGKSLRAMRVPQVDMGPRGQMGITWFIRKVDDLRIYAHGGATNGQMAGLYYIPDEDFSIAILANSDEGRIITDRVMNWALEIYFGKKASVPKPINVPVSELRQYVGRYRIGTECLDLKIKNGALMYYHIPLGGFPTPDAPPGPALPPMRLAFYEEDRLIGLDEPLKDALGDFIRDEKGRVRFFRISGRAHKKIS